MVGCAVLHPFAAAISMLSDPPVQGPPAGYIALCSDTISQISHVLYPRGCPLPALLLQPLFWARESLEKGGGGLPSSPLPTALTLPERHSHTPTPAPTAFPTARNRPPTPTPSGHIPCDRCATALGLPRRPTSPSNKALVLVVMVLTHCRWKVGAKVGDEVGKQEAVD